MSKQVVLRPDQSRLDYAPLNACFRVPGADTLVKAGIERFRSPTPEGQAARLAVAKALELKNTEFNVQGTEMNQRCESMAVLPIQRRRQRQPRGMSTYIVTPRHVPAPNSHMPGWQIGSTTVSLRSTLLTKMYIR